MGNADVAEKLAAAADLLDERASKANAGPWRAAEYDVVGNSGGTVLLSAVDGSEADASYIAAADPVVGLELASWLREMGTDASFWGVTDQNAGSMRHALAIAALLTGSGS